MTEITYCTDEPTNKDYLFSEYETFIDKDEYGKGVNSMRPQETKIWNQGNTPACTCYSACHVYNGENLLEDKRLWENRQQQDPAVIWNQFCAKRNIYNAGTSIQTMANYYKERWLIKGYVTIKNAETDVVAKMKKALDMGMFISTGSMNGDWSAIKKTWIYVRRKDNLDVWHAWCIVDYWDGYFWCVNSYGDKRWPYNGMFKLPFELATNVYSKLVFIDQDDKWSFASLADKKKSEELVRIAKELYANGNNQIKAYFEQIQLANNIQRLYK